MMRRAGAKSSAVLLGARLHGFRRGELLEAIDVDRDRETPGPARDDHRSRGRRPRPPAPANRRQSSQKFCAPSFVWKPTTSAPSRPSRSGARHGSCAKSSWGGNGNVKEEADPDVRPTLADHGRRELQVIVVDPDEALSGNGLRAASSAKRRLTSDVRLPPAAIDTPAVGSHRDRAARAFGWRNRRSTASMSLRESRTGTLRMPSCVNGFGFAPAVPAQPIHVLDRSRRMGVNAETSPPGLVSQDVVPPS